MSEPTYYDLMAGVEDADGGYNGLVQCELCGALVVKFPGDGQKTHTEWHKKQERKPIHAAFGLPAQWKPLNHE